MNSDEVIEQARKLGGEKFVKKFDYDFVLSPTIMSIRLDYNTRKPLKENFTESKINERNKRIRRKNKRGVTKVLISNSQ